MKELGDFENRLGTEIVDAAFKVHSNLGPGLLESVYETCLCYEFEKRELNFERQKPIKIAYEEVLFEIGFVADIVVEGYIVIELKAVDQIRSVHEAQLLTYMKLLKVHLGFLINFNERYIKDGIRRRIISEL